MSNRSLAKRARYFKSDPEGVESMCQVMDEIREEGIEQGMAQGIEQGMAQGVAQGRSSTLFELVRDRLLAPEAAAARLGVTPEEFASRAAQTGYKLA